MWQIRSKELPLYRPASVGLLAALLGCLVAATPFGLYWEEEAGLPWLFRIRGLMEAPADVIVVNIDETSATALGQPRKISDWDRAVHARLVDRLVQLGASTIVFDLFFDEIRDADTVFAAAMERAQRVVLVQQLIHKKIDGYLTQTVSDPTAVLANAASGLATFPLPVVPHRVSQFWSFVTASTPTIPVVALQVHILQTMGYEGFTGLLKRAGHTELLPVSVENARDLSNLMTILRNRLRSDQNDAMGLVRAIETHEGLSREVKRLLRSLVKAYVVDGSQYINFYGPAKSIETLSYKTVLDKENHTMHSLTGKTVFVGSQDSSSYNNDMFYTAFTGARGIDLSGVEISATAFANLLSDNTLKYPGPVLRLALLLMFGFVVGFAAYCLRGIWATLAVGIGTGFCYSAATLLLFKHSSLWLPLFVPILIQLPIALAAGLMLQYLETRRERENVVRALGFHVPQDVARRLTSRSSPMMPERVYGTCLSSDVADYTSLAEKLSPEHLVSLSNEYFADVGACVKGHGGEMMEIVGDGMTCVWSNQHPDREQRLDACLSALDILEAVERFNVKHTDYPFYTRIGLDAGWLAMGHMGGSGHFVYGVAGDIANSASRIEGLNKYLGTNILADEKVVEELDQVLLLRPVGCFRFKGKATALNVIEIIGRQEHVTSERRLLCERFSKALELFLDRRWSDAAGMFKTLLVSYPDDRATAFYFEQCQQYRVNPPLVGDGSVIQLRDK